MAQPAGKRKDGSAAPRGNLERLSGLERLLEAALSGVPDTVPAPVDPQVIVDVLGRAHQIEPVRKIADKRRSDAVRCRGLFAASPSPM